MNTTQKIARLKQLNREECNNFFDRIKLAAEVMEDHEWIASTFDGDDLKAMEYLETNAFSLIASIYTVGELIATYRHFPSKADWEQNKFDLHVMVSMWRDARRTPLEPRERTNWRKRCEELQEENTRLRLELADLKVIVAELRHPAV